MNTDTFKNTIERNSTTILTGAGIAGVVLTAVLTARAAIRASSAITLAEDVKWTEARETDPDFDQTKNAGLTVREKVALNWKLFVPAAASGGATIACIVWANRIGLQRNAALLAAAALADTAFREYKSEVLEQIGEAKERKVRDAVAVKRMTENPPDKSIVVVGGDETICYDMFGGRYFRCSMETLNQAANLVNSSILGGNGCASLNEFYEAIGLDSVAGGEVVGFNIDNQIRLGFTSHLSPDGRPCLAVYFVDDPKADFGKCF